MTLGDQIDGGNCAHLSLRKPSRTSRFRISKGVYVYLHSVRVPATLMWVRGRL